MQNTAAEFDEARRAGDRRGGSLTLADLGAVTEHRQLRDLYLHGDTPSDLATLDGDPAGRMLAVRGLGAGRAAELVRRFAGAEFFPWEGKSFEAESADRGLGVNRLRLGGRYKLFEFHTFYGESRLDGDPTIVLDYELPENPWFIRAIHDEIREVDDGLFLGPAMWKGGRGATLVVWFGLDTATQMPFSTRRGL